MSILLRTTRELGGHGHINGRVCSFVRAGAVRMCTVLVRGLGMGCVLPTRQGARPELILELVCYISRVYRAVRCSAWIVQAVVYVECVCVCVR